MSQQDKPENFVKNFAENFGKNFALNCPPPKRKTSPKTSLCRNPLLIKIYYRIVIYDRGAPCVDAIFLGIAYICPLKEGFTA